MGDFRKSLLNFLKSELCSAVSVVEMGNGDLWELLKKACPEKKLIFVSPSFERVEAARGASLQPDRVVALRGDVFVEDDRARYDALICHNILEDIDDVPRFFKAAYERLREGGKVVVVAKNPGRGWKNAFTLNPERLEEIVSRAGFKVKRAKIQAPVLEWKNTQYIVGIKPNSSYDIVAM